MSRNTSRKVAFCLGLVAVWLAAVSSADAARRRPSSPPERSSGPETPEIRSTAENKVPTCVLPDRLMQFLQSQNAGLEPKFRMIASEYKRHGEALRIRWDFAFYQMLLETNYLKFTGDVKPKQNNFAGIGATGGGVPGDSFPDVSTGVLAQMQHLVAYSGEMVADPVAPRTRLVQDGVVAQSKRLGRPVRFADLTRRWAADSKYARMITSVADRYKTAHCNGVQVEETPVAAAAPELPQKTAVTGTKTPEAHGKRRGAALAQKALEEKRDEPATVAALGAGSGALPMPPVESNGACNVMSASFGGTVTLLIRSESAKGVTLTALDVEGGSEDNQAASYIASHAPGGKVTGRFKSRSEAVAHAYDLCDSGRP